MSTNLFDLTGKVAIITGGAGLLGEQHARAIASVGGHPIIIDIDAKRVQEKAYSVGEEFVSCGFFSADMTQKEWVDIVLRETLALFGRVDILVNNVCRNPTMTDGQTNRFETFPETEWDLDLAVGLKSYFLCSKIIGGWMAQKSGGVIVNIASDLSAISPDQRLYRRDDLGEDKQPVKPVTYSVIKHGVIGLTKYLATYWAGRVRVNALSPGGIYNNQDVEFVRRVEQLIPMKRMAKATEMRGALLFLCSSASEYMTGQNVVIDGGRSVW